VKPRDDIPPLEWAVAIVGGLILVAVLGFTLRQALTLDDEPGPITFAVKQVRPAGAGFLVVFEARNGGSTTYAELEVEGTLRGFSGSVERATVTFDYLPGGSSRAAGLFFGGDPAQGRLELAPKAYREP
jgi:uncharacterized protein (TIGR02588 family)